MKKYRPTDATTNPSLILNAANNDKFKPIIDEAVLYAKKAAKYVKNILFI